MPKLRKVSGHEAVKIFWDENIQRLQEKMVEYLFGVIKDKGKKLGYINFLTLFTKNCDCMAKDESPLMDDIGILASSDPVAIEKASADLINQKAGRDIFRQFFPEIDWSIQLKYAADLKLGSLRYELVEI